jgi:hypothetical protein
MMLMMQQIWKKTRPQSLSNLPEIHGYGASHKNGKGVLEVNKASISFNFAQFAGNTYFGA